LKMVCRRQTRERLEGVNMARIDSHKHESKYKKHGPTVT
jgi:hypothetical protein